MHSKSLIWRSITLVMVFMMTLSPVFASPGQVVAQGDQPPQPRPSNPFFAGKTVQGQPDAQQAALEKIHPDLRDLAEKAGAPLPARFGKQVAQAEPVYVTIVLSLPEEDTKEPLPDFSGYFSGVYLPRPPVDLGEERVQFLFGEVSPHLLAKIAANDAVQTILPVKFEQTGYPDDMPIDGQKPLPEKRGPADWAALRQDAAKVREGVLPWTEAKAYGDGRELMRPQDWYEVMPEGPHKAEAAWDRGFTGEGVTVAVIDDGIDFAHADLMGTQKIYNYPGGSPYDGWPYVFSPFSMFLYGNDVLAGATYIQDGYPSAHYVDTSTMPRLFPCTPEVVGAQCFTFTPLIDYATPGDMHTYMVDVTMSLSGRIHVGTHPDRDLRDFVWGELPAVLVTDPNTAGVYDTVYIDLDNDYDFRDEKPLTKADVSTPATLEATKNNMIAYRDLNGDGLADISGGMLYYIADGSTCIPASDWYWGCGFIFGPPANGDLIAISGSTFDGPYSHGTQCASNVVGQGVVNALLPEFQDLAPNPGKPSGAVFGMAPDAKVVNVSDVYFNFATSKLDAYTFMALGYDGWASALYDDDEIQISSNSYGNSNVDNDGWEYDGQYVTKIQLGSAPRTQFLFSTGNGAPGYGTSAPPSPGGGIGVGASTEFGSTGWDSIKYTDQIMNNDVIPWSNRGPSARGTNGVDIVAGGAYAAGDEELNYYPISTWGEYDGNYAWATWGGTSRSAPTAMGVTALLYQAYKDKFGDFPDFTTIKQLLKASATDLEYDTFVQGAGSVNADLGTLLANGEYGTYTDLDEWNPGDFRGADYPYFAHVVYPGDHFTRTVTVNNPSPYPMTVGLSEGTPTRIGSKDLSFTVTPAMHTALQDLEMRHIRSPQLLLPITARPASLASNPWWGSTGVSIPAGTDLMIIRMRYPYGQFDPDGDYSPDNSMRLVVYNWKDLDFDHKVWNDANGNGVVDYEFTDVIDQIDAQPAIDWTTAEMDRYEWGRFSYNRPDSNTYEVSVRDPQGRMLDGLFIGLTQVGSVATTNISFTIDFYQYQPTGWLSVPSSVVVPAAGSTTFEADLQVPADLAPGMYEAAIKLKNPPVLSYTGYTSVIPVSMAVAAKFTGDNEFGGQDTYMADANLPYNNGAVRGATDWGWRPETGDWRFFFMDIDNRPASPADETTVVAADFNSGVPPAGWLVTDNAGDGLFWDTTTNQGYPNRTGGSGDAAMAWGYFGGLDTELITPLFNLTPNPGENGAFLTYRANYNNYAGIDFLDVDISTDGGTTWQTLLRWNEDHGNTSTSSFSAYGEMVTVDLTQYMHMTGLRLRWHYYDPNAIADDWWAQVDDVRVVTGKYPFPGASHVIVRDVWDDAAPHTDIDTIVLGPTPNRRTLTSATWPPYFGPYTLDTVARSQDTNLGDGTWIFDTTSGGAEEWVSFPLKDGLHNLLQHQVLFEGDKFWAPFAKTVGLLTEDIHSFEINTFVDEGLIGTVALSSTLDLNGMVADGFLIDVDTTDVVDEPLGLDGWIDEFDVANGYSLDISTSSPDISDIDLFLYICIDAACNSLAQVASSAGSDSNEHVSLAHPEDGTYVIYIDNYAQVEGHFNLQRVVKTDIGGLTTEVSPSGALPAGAKAEVELGYDYAFEAGKTYEGLVFIGVPEAPSLKTIPITIHRLPESAMVRKQVDVVEATQGQELNYKIQLFNLSDATADFTFHDAIPAGTTYVSDDMGWYNAGMNALHYEGPLPLTAMAASLESFEHEGDLPADWSVENLGTGGWSVLYDPAYAHSGDYAMFHDWAPTDSDSWLFTPPVQIISGTADTMSFWAWSDTTWPGANVTLVAIDADDNETEVWSMLDDEFWPDIHDGYHKVTVDLNSLLSQEEPSKIITLAWQYAGLNGQMFVLDDVELPGVVDYVPSMEVNLKVKVGAAVPDGTIVTNDARLDATHSPPLVPFEQDEPQVSAQAQTAIGDVDLSTSYKSGVSGIWPGGYIHYEIHLKNTGAAPALGVTVDDPIPTGTVYVDHFPGAGPYILHYDSLNDKMVWEGTVLPGEEIVLHYVVKVTATSGTITNTATMSWNGVDTDLKWVTVVQDKMYFLPLVGK